MNHSDKYGIVYHSTNKLSRHIIENHTNNKIQYIHKSMKSNKIVVLKKIIPYPWQKIIIKKLIKFFSKQNKGILSAPSGTGKTLISCCLGKKYKQLTFISPFNPTGDPN